MRVYIVGVKTDDACAYMLTCAHTHTCTCTHKHQHLHTGMYYEDYETEEPRGTSEWVHLTA